MPELCKIQLLLSGDKEMNVYTFNSTSHATTTGRISFTFGLHGLCVAYDTVCSSSLLSLHHTERSLQYKGCERRGWFGVKYF